MSSAALVAAVTLFALGVILGVLKLRSRMTPHKFAIALAGYFSLFFISMVHAGGAELTAQRVLVDAGILAICWTVVYAMAYWIYRAMDS
jgi:hypothetical protein